MCFNEIRLQYPVAHWAQNLNQLHTIYWKILLAYGLSCHGLHRLMASDLSPMQTQPHSLSAPPHLSFLALAKCIIVDIGDQNILGLASFGNRAEKILTPDCERSLTTKFPASNHQICVALVRCASPKVSLHQSLVY